MNDFIQNKVIPFAQKIENNFILSAISGAFMKVMPALLGGAVFSLFQGLPLGDWYTNFLSSTGISDALAVGVAVCNLTALYFIFALGYNLGEKFNVNPFQTAIVSLLSLLLVTPFSYNNVDNTNGAVTLIKNVIPVDNLGASGIFTAMLCGIIGAYVFAFAVNHNWKIKLPDSVPEMVSKPFEAVVPAFLVSALFLLVRSGFAVTSYGNIQNFIYTMVQAPLVSLGNSFPAMLISMLILLLLWWVGIHGTSVVLSVMMVIWMEPAITILNNYMAGEPVTLVTTYMFFFVFCQFIGGPGCLFGLTCDMAIFAKSERFKAFGKVCFVPGMFNIVEPVIFGFPIVLNPIMFIPFILTPLVFMIIGYLLMVTGVVNIPALMLSVMTIPGPIAGFILGGGISLGIMIVIMCLLSCIIYYPFFKICDNQALEAEKKSNQEKTLEENKI